MEGRDTKEFLVPVDDNGTFFNDVPCPDDYGTRDCEYRHLGMYDRPYEQQQQEEICAPRLSQSVSQ